MTAGTQSFTVKPLWEMTREEYFNDVARVRRDAGDYGIVGKQNKWTYMVRYAYVAPSPAGPFEGSCFIDAGIDAKPRRGDVIQAAFGSASVKSVSTTKTRVAEKPKFDLEQLLAIGKEMHRAAVVNALAAGYAVPEIVLSDYPDVAIDNEENVPAPR